MGRYDWIRKMEANRRDHENKANLLMIVTVVAVMAINAFVWYMSLGDSNKGTYLELVLMTMLYSFTFGGVALYHRIKSHSGHRHVFADLVILIFSTLFFPALNIFVNWLPKQSFYNNMMWSFLWVVCIIPLPILVGMLLFSFWLWVDDNYRYFKWL